MPKYYKTAKWQGLIKRLNNDDPGLTILDLNYNYLEFSALQELALALQRNTHIKELHLHDNNITDDGVELLCKLLDSNSTINLLGLGKNKFGVAGAKRLSQLLRKNKSLHALYLGGNDIKIEGANALNQALQENTSLFIFTLESSFVSLEKNFLDGINVKLKKNAQLHIATDKEIKFLQQQASKGDAESQYKLGKKYLNGSDGFEKNFETAQKLFFSAAKKGYPAAQTRVGEANLGKRDYLFQKYNQVAVEWLRKASDGGDSEASLILGTLYLGIFDKFFLQDLPQDPKEGLKWLHLSAEKGNATAQHYLGVLYEGEEKKYQVTANKQEAIKWHRKATEQDNHYSQHRLALLLSDGSFEELREAEKLYLEAREQSRIAELLPSLTGEAKFFDRLGEMYEAGYRVPKNIVKAISWYERCSKFYDYQDWINRAAHISSYDATAKALKRYSPDLVAIVQEVEKGAADGQLRLGHCFLLGNNGLDKDVDEALKWYQKAAAQNYTAAANLLGMLLEAGIGRIEKNEIQAITYYKRSGNTEAEKRINKSKEEARNTTEEEKRIDARSKEWDDLLERLHANDSSLIAVNLRSRFISDKKVEQLATALANNRTVVSLNLRENHIFANEAQFLTTMLMENKTLTSLDLKDNHIGAEGVQGLGQLVKVHPNLSSLIFNKFTRVDPYEIFAQALKDNYVLTSLYFEEHFNLYSHNTNEKEIAFFLKRNEALRDQLHLSVLINDQANVRALLTKGLSLLSTTGQEENTPLHWAVQFELTEMIKLLLQEMQTRQLPLNVKNKMGKTAKDLANGAPKILSLFLSTPSEAQIFIPSSWEPSAEKQICDEDESKRQMANLKNEKKLVSNIFMDNIARQYKGEKVSPIISGEESWEDYLLKKAIDGDDTAFLHLGVHYESKEQYKKAYQCYSKATVTEEPAAYFFLAACYKNGIGVEKNEKLAFANLKQAASKGCCESQYEFGVYHAEGIGTELNFTEAARWFLESARHCHPPAMLRIAECYKFGIGVQVDKSQAFEWYSFIVLDINEEEKRALNFKHATGDDDENFHKFELCRAQAALHVQKLLEEQLTIREEFQKVLPIIKEKTQAAILSIQKAVKAVAELNLSTKNFWTEQHKEQSRELVLTEEETENADGNKKFYEPPKR